MVAAGVTSRVAPRAAMTGRPWSLGPMCFCCGALALVGAATLWLMGPRATLGWLTMAGIAAALSPKLAGLLKYRESVAVLKSVVELPLRAGELVLDWYGGNGAATAGTQLVTSNKPSGNMMSEVSIDVDTCLHFIVRDFVLSWYHALSANSQFSKEVYYVLEDLAVAVRSRLRKIKRYRVARKAVLVYHAYFKQYLRCSERVDDEVVNAAASDSSWPAQFARHAALASETSELCYLRHVVSVLLEVLTPIDIRTCTSAKKLMVDILATNVLLPLIDLVSDPDWVNGKLIVLLEEKQAKCCLPGPIQIDSSQNGCDNDVCGDLKVSSAKDKTEDDDNGRVVDDNGKAAEETVDGGKVAEATVDNKEAAKDEEAFCSSACEPMLVHRSVDSNDTFLSAESEVRCSDAGDEIFAEEVDDAAANKIDDERARPTDNENQHRRSLPSSMSFEHLSSFLSNVREELEKPVEYITDNIAHYFRTSSNESTSSSSALKDGNAAARLNPSDLFSIEDGIPGVSLLRRRSTSIIEQSHSISQALEGAMTASTGPLMATKLQEIRAQASHDPPSELCNDAAYNTSLISNHMSSNLPKSISGVHNVRAELKSTDSVLFLNLKRSLPSGSDEVQEALSFESNDDMLEEAVELSPDNRCFMNLSISSAEVADEPGGLDHYILYCIQYDAWYLDRPFDYPDTGDMMEQQRMVLQRTQVKRRFREFITLAHRIDENPLLKPCAQNIRRPSRPKIPLMNKFDKDMVKDRRVLLELYLQKLIAVEKIAMSSELREFLAYGGDASIAYVTKVSEGMVPRIDKFLAKKVSGMLDKFRLPKPGTSIDDIARQQLSSSKAPERKSFLGIPLGSSDDFQNVQVKFGFSDNETEASKLESSMRRSVSDTKNEWANGSQSTPVNGGFNLNMFAETPASPDRTFFPADGFPNGHNGDTDEADGSSFANDGDDDAAGCMICIDRDIPLASAVIDLGLDGITNEETLLKKSNCIYLLKLIGGNYLEKYLHSKVDEYTTTEKCLHYLREGRDAVWPGGVLPMDPDPSRSEDEVAATKAEALQKLKEFFPSVIPLMLGSDVYDDALQLFFSSFQHPKLLRHLCYQILDLVVETIAPEVKLESFHARLMNS